MKPVLAVQPPSTYQRRKKAGEMSHQQHAFMKKKMAAALDNFTMSDCYEKLKELVPSIPRDRKISRVEILQHVIDYIQDLQTALDGLNINVRDIPFTVSSFSSSSNPQISGPSTVRRTPFATLQAPASSHYPPMSCTQETLSKLREMSCTSGLSVSSKLHPYDTPESSPDSQPCTC